MIIELITIFISALTLVYIWWKIRCSKYGHIRFVDGALPLIGNAHLFPKEPEGFCKFIQSLHSKYGDNFMLWLGPLPFFHSRDPKFIEALLSSRTEITKSPIYNLIQGWLGTGLLLSSGEKWRFRRKALTPSFHFSILESFTQIFIKQAGVLVDKLSENADSGKPVDIQTPIGLCALDIICETAMGVQINAQSGADSNYVKAVLRMCVYMQYRNKNPWLMNDFLYSLTQSGRDYRKDLNTLLDFTRTIIASRIKQKQTDQNAECSPDGAPAGNRKKAFLDMLLDVHSRNEIDLEGIREEVDTFMFEGHDTTSAGMSWVVWLVGHHPEVQARLHQEIDEADQTDAPLVDRIRSLKFLEACMKESQRLYPSVPMFSRRLKEDMEVNGVRVPKGTDFTIFTHSVHTNPSYWEDPLVFKPERFLDEEFHKRNPYIYIPFSAGSRNCIGQKFAVLEEKIVLYHILKSFRLESVETHDQVGVAIELITRAKNGLLVNFYKR